MANYPHTERPEHCPLCGQTLGNRSLADHLVPPYESVEACPEREAASRELERRIERREARAA